MAYDLKIPGHRRIMNLFTIGTPALPNL